MKHTTVKENYTDLVESTGLSYHIRLYSPFRAYDLKQKNSFLFCVFQPYICEGSDRRGGSWADLNHVSSPVRTPWERHRLLQLQPAIQNRPTNTQNVGQHPQRSTKLSHVATEIPTGKCLKCVVFRVFFTHLPAGANFSRYQKFLMWVYPDFFWLANYVIFFYIS